MLQVGCRFWLRFARGLVGQKVDREKLSLGLEKSFSSRKWFTMSESEDEVYCPSEAVERSRKKASEMTSPEGSPLSSFCSPKFRPNEPLLVLPLDAEEALALKMFANRWRDADQVLDCDEVCVQVWQEHELLGVLGTGRYGKVYKARHKSTKKTLSLKLCGVRTLGEGWTSDEQARALHNPSENFDEEEVAGRVRHVRMELALLRSLAGICPFVLDINEEFGYSCIADKKEGMLGFPLADMSASLRDFWTTFNDKISGEKNQPLMDDVRKLLVFWLAQISDAVGFLHRCHIIHGDVRAESIFVGHDWYIKLGSFENSFIMSSKASGMDPELKPSKSVKEANFQRFFQEQSRLDNLGHGDRYLCKIESAKRSEYETLAALTKATEWVCKTYDFFSLAKTILALDWPYDEVFARNYDTLLTVDTLRRFQEERQSEHLKTSVITGDLLDFVNCLMITATVEPDSGTDMFFPSSNLISHKVFGEINFELLRMKSIPVPVHNLLNEVMMQHDLQEAKVADLAEEKAYCETLTKEQWQVFKQNFLEKN